MKCKVCCGKTKNIYTTKLLPEYIWPKNIIKIKKSKCKVFSCYNCSHLQLQNFSKKKIKSFYGSQNFALAANSQHKIRILKIKNFYGNNFFKNNKILEVGGGINPFMLKKKDYDIIDFFILKKIKKKLKENAFEKDIDNFKIKKKYDTIILFHTLEHLAYPGRALIKLKKSLNKNGLIFIEVPNFDFFIKYRPHYAIFHQHLNMFCIQSLKNLMHYCGFKIDNIFKNKDVLFCSFKKNSKNNFFIKKINNIKKIFTLKKNLYKLEGKLKKFIKKNKFNVYGCGGTATLLINNYPFLKKLILNLYDSDNRKNKKFLPGIKHKIKKFKNINLKIKSLSFFSLKKNNNLQIL